MITKGRRLLDDDLVALRNISQHCAETYVKRTTSSNNYTGIEKRVRCFVITGYEMKIHTSEHRTKTGSTFNSH